MADLRAFAASMSRVEPVRLAPPPPVARQVRQPVKLVIKSCLICGKRCPRGYWVTCGSPDCKRRMHRAAERNREHIERAVVSDITARQEAEMRRKARDCPLCKVRLTSKPHLPNSKELDHILPICMGGTHTLGNVRIICRTCNLRRPKDGSDYTGQLSLWAQGPSPVGRQRTMCGKGLHPWIPENIVTWANGRKRCRLCRIAGEIRRGRRQSSSQRPMRQCRCGALFPQVGRTFLCPDCMTEAGHRAAGLHAGGMPWAEVAQHVGYQSDEGARFAAKRAGYVPERWRAA